MGRVLANAGAAADTQIRMAAMPVSIKPPTAPNADTPHQAAGNENYRAPPEDGGSSRRIAEYGRLVAGGSRSTAEHRSPSMASLHAGGPLPLGRRI
jgi:hypothetical protein